jgi:hypothetical protein
VRPQAIAKIPICAAVSVLCEAASGRGTGTGKLTTSGIELMSEEYVATVAAACPCNGGEDFN